MPKSKNPRPPAATCPTCKRRDVFTYVRHGEAQRRITYHDDPSGAACAGGGELVSSSPPTIFVFGSNRTGWHGAGAALHALRECGAVYGQAEGLQGRSYGIITKELRQTHPPVKLTEVNAGVKKFLTFARRNPHLTFEVTPIGCGLAGFTVAQVAPLFGGRVPKNVRLPKEFTDLLE